MKVRIEGKTLIIELPITGPVRSTTGKSFTIATTSGNKQTDILVEGKPLTIGVNAYISAK